MPVRSSSSAVLKWPEAQAVLAAAERWACELAAREPAVVGVGYFGSYARGDHGVGSDLDLVVVVAESAEPIERRAARWDTTGLPVPADLLVYTRAEWTALVSGHPRGVPLGVVRWVVHRGL
jgi:predicted nucleotidyltransferase